MNIKVCEPTITSLEKEYVNQCLDEGYISSMGKFVERFEKQFSKFCGAKYGVSCSNGTNALHLALRCLNIGKDDEVILPTFTMIATAAAVTYVGAKPVFVDAELKTWNIDIDKIEEKITPKTKAIIVVHTYGCPVDMDKVNEIASKHKLFVIEDAAEAHGADYKDRKVGSLSDIACFSFYANKIITTGEGGMIVTNSKTYADRARYLRNHAFTIPRFVHTDIGYNYRMTNIQAAIGCAQMEKAYGLIGGRILNANIYDDMLKDIPGITLPPKCEYGKNVYWMYGILIDPKKFGMTKNELRDKLEFIGIETRDFFYPMHKQLALKEYWDNEKYPISEQLYEQGLYLPSSSNVPIQQLKEVAISIKAIREKNKK